MLDIIVNSCLDVKFVRTVFTVIEHNRHENLARVVYKLHIEGDSRNMRWTEAGGGGQDSRYSRLVLAGIILEVEALLRPCSLSATHSYTDTRAGDTTRRNNITQPQVSALICGDRASREQLRG